MQKTCLHCGRIFNGVYNRKYCKRKKCQHAKLLTDRIVARDKRRAERAGIVKMIVCRHCQETVVLERLGQSRKHCYKEECVAAEKARLRKQNSAYVRVSGVFKKDNPKPQKNSLFCQRCAKRGKWTALYDDERWNCPECRRLLSRINAFTEPEWI